MDERVEWALTKAAMWDEVKDKLKQSGHGAVGRPAAAAVHRPRGVGSARKCCCSTSRPRRSTRSRPRKIEELISELKADYTIAIVTHNMQQAARVSD